MVQCSCIGPTMCTVMRKRTPAGEQQKERENEAEGKSEQATEEEEGGAKER